MVVVLKEVKQSELATVELFVMAFLCWLVGKSSSILFKVLVKLSLEKHFPSIFIDSMMKCGFLFMIT